MSISGAIEPSSLTLANTRLRVVPMVDVGSA